VYVIRKRIDLSPETAIFIYVDNVLPPTSSAMSLIYENSQKCLVEAGKFATSRMNNCTCSAPTCCIGANSHHKQIPV
jgi:hypothetical protein